MSYDPPVLLHKTVLMQRIADYIRLGYHWHTSGTVQLHKTTTFVRKISSLYLVHIRKDERYRRKRQNLGNAVLLLWQPEPSSGTIAWWLLVTDGHHPAHQLERLRNAQRERVNVTGYELALMTKPDHAKPVLTWRMSKETYEAWRERIIKSVRAKTDMQLNQAWYSLYRTPGFAGIRQQVGKLVALFRAEYQRSRSEPFSLPRMKLRYVQRLKNTQIPLSAVLRQAHASSRLAAAASTAANNSVRVGL